MGIAIAMLTGFLCCYTSYLIVEQTKGYERFYDAIEAKWGKIPSLAACFSQMILIYGAVIVFFVLMV